MQTLDLKPLAEAYEAATGVRPNLATIYRHRQKGLHGIKLQTWLVGGKRYTTVDAVLEFVQRTTAARDGAVSPLPNHADRVAAAEQQLAVEGL